MSGLIFHLLHNGVNEDIKFILCLFVEYCTALKLRQYKSFKNGSIYIVIRTTTGKSMKAKRFS